jgi:hypothetical protein
MDQNSIDARAAAAIARQAGVSRTEQHEIKREDGTTPLPAHQPAGPGQVDSTIRFSEWKEPAKSKAINPATQRNIDPPADDPDDAIEIGNVTIRPNMIAGTWEGAFTRGGQASHEVLVKGRRVLGDSGIAAVYAALREQAKKVRK